MKSSLSRILWLFFWGMVVKSLHDLMTLSVSFTQEMLIWLVYGMWGFAALLMLSDFCRHIRHYRHHTDKEVPREP